MRASPKGTPICIFSVASNRYYRQGNETQNEVSYFDVETWARLAEVCGEELAKGRGVRVVGRLKQDRWEDKEGKMQSKVKIVAEHVEFLTMRAKQGEPKHETKGEDDSVEEEMF
jgi:single-strand DNA-binding protein